MPDPLLPMFSNPPPQQRRMVATTAPQNPFDKPRPRAATNTSLITTPTGRDWITPPEILDALGPFDTDPCASIQQPWRTAATMYTSVDDGLTQPWTGRVWLHPPHGPDVDRWLIRMSEHRHGTALLFACTDSAEWHEHIWPNASAILFLRGRWHFHQPMTGKRFPTATGTPIALVAYGDTDATALGECTLKGWLINPPDFTTPPPAPVPLIPRQDTPGPLPTTAAVARALGITAGRLRAIGTKATRCGVELKLPRRLWPDDRTPLWDENAVRQWRKRQNQHQHKEPA